MDAILEGLQALEGVLAVVAIDPSGQIVGYRAHAVYDVALLQQVCRGIASAMDSVQLLHDDWDSASTTFSDGRLLIRNLGGAGPRPKGSLLALLVIADARLNASFAGVAIRVAVAKLKALSAKGTPAAPGQPLAPSLHASSPVTSSPNFGHSSGAVTAAVALSSPHAVAGRVEVAGSGLSWSGLGGSSAMAASGVAVSDAVSAAYLTLCTKALAKCVGPMAKAFVKEAIRKLWPNRPFSRELGPVLVLELERHIEDKDDLLQFRATMKSV